MTNLEKANKAVLRLLEDDVWYFADIKPLVVFWEPQLAHSYYNGRNEEVFLYFIEWKKRKFFIQIAISENCDTYSGAQSRIDIRSGNYDKVVDEILEQYPHYLSVQELVLKFITEDLPKLQNHNRDKTLFVICNIDKWQWNIGHLYMKHDFLKLVTEAWIWLNYIVQLQ